MEIRRPIMDMVFPFMLHAVHDLAPFIDMVAQKNKRMVDVGENRPQEEKPGEMMIVHRQGAGDYMGEYHMTK